MIYVKLDVTLPFFNDCGVQYFPAGTFATAREIDSRDGSAYGLRIEGKEDWTCSWLPHDQFIRISPLERLAMEAV